MNCHHLLLCTTLKNKEDTGTFDITQLNKCKSDNDFLSSVFGLHQISLGYIKHTNV